MQRVQAAKIDESHPLFQKLKAITSQMGFVLNDSLIMAHRPEIADAFSGLTESILRQGSLSGELKRMIGLVASLARTCRYCSSHTSYSAEKLQVAPEKIQAIWDFENSMLFSAKEKVALRLAYKASMSPNQSEMDDFTEMKNYYSSEEIVEIVSTISFYAFLNTFNQTLATEIEAKPLASLEQFEK